MKDLLEITVRANSENIEELKKDILKLQKVNASMLQSLSMVAFVASGKAIPPGLLEAME